MALTACASNPEAVYSVPPLNEQDSKKLACGDYPDIKETLREIPPHVFLSGADGQPVETAGGHRWVRFDVANKREAMTIKFGTHDGADAHFECQANLNWLASVYTDLEAIDR